MCLTLVLATAGCLSPAPTYEDRRRIPPFIVAGEVDPPLSVVHRLPPGQTGMQITVPFFSEDLGEAVVAVVSVDPVPGADEQLYVQATFSEPPSTYDVPRFITFDVDLVGTGCHTVMVVLTHASNLNNRESVIREERAARAVWWVDVPAEGTKTLLETCPRAGGVLEGDDG